MNLPGVLPPLLALLALALPGAHAEVNGLPSYEIGQSDLIAPITSTRIGDYYTAKIGPAAWVCTNLNHSEPDVAYDSLKSYIDMGNKDSVQMVNNTWPVIESKGAKNELCIYLAKKFHCYPPEPNDKTKVRGINEHLYRHYYGRVFWGQASDKRVTYEEDLLKAALAKDGVAETKYNSATRYLAYYPNHVREIRFDAKDPEMTELAESSFTSEFMAAANT